MLLTFIAELLQNEKAQRTFSKDPNAAIRKAKLTAEQRKALESRDPERIANLLAKEIAQGGPVGWPAPKLSIKSIDPEQGSPGQTISPFTIHGSFFGDDVKANIESGSTRVAVTGIRVVNANQEDCSLTGKLALPKTLPLGSYTVRVVNDPEDEATAPNAFQVKRTPAR